MILSNYYNLMKYHSNKTSATTSSSYFKIPNIKNMNGGNENTAVYDSGAITSAYPGSRLYLVVGSGDTPVTPNDYDLAVDETSNFSNISQNFFYKYNQKTKQGNMCFVLKGVNNTANTIIIKEVGLAKGIASQNGSNQGRNRTYLNLITRELLENPIEVIPGDMFSIIYYWCP